jgi:hypothetical protein
MYRAAILKGSKDMEIVKNDPWLDRKAEMADLQSFLLSPSRRNKPKFNLVTGIRGCGKSSLVAECAKEMGERIIYINFIKGDEEAALVETIARAINYHPLMAVHHLPILKMLIYTVRYLISPPNKSFTDIMNVINIATEQLSDADAENHEHTRYPLFIYDNLGALVDDDKNRLLTCLVERSRYARDNNLYSTVLIANDENGTLSKIKAQSGSSRIGLLYEVKNVSHKQAEQYLEAKFRFTGLLDIVVTQKDIQKLVQMYTGGRLQALHNSVEYISDGQSIDSIIDTGVAFVASRLQGPLSIHDWQRKPDAFAVWSLLKKMHSMQGSCKYEEAYQWILHAKFGNKGDMIKEEEAEKIAALLEKLVKEGVLARIHSNPIRLRFHNRLVKTFVERALNEEGLA